MKTTFRSKVRFIPGILLLILGLLICILGPALVSYYSSEIVSYLSLNRYDSSWPQTWANSVLLFGVLVTVAGLTLTLYQSQMGKEHLNTTNGPGSSQTGAIRQLLVTALNDNDLMTLCFDRFYPVYNEKFGSGMGKSEKVQHLLDYCVRQGTLQDLLELVKERNPYQYAIYEERIFTESTRT